jgi:energy-coupling factor transport system ATP-binding protein
VDGVPLETAAPAVARAAVRLVPQTAADLLYLDTVAQECAAADRAAGGAAGTCRGIVDALVAPLAETAHPRDLSEGQRLALVLAIQLSGAAPVLLLDEPTRGLDYRAKAALTVSLRQLAEVKGRAICVATHDVEFAAGVADRAVVMATGAVIAEGPAGEVLAASTVFAPQVAKTLAPSRYLTVAQVARALGTAER